MLEPQTQDQAAAGSVCVGRCGQRPPACRPLPGRQEALDKPPQWRPLDTLPGPPGQLRGDTSAIVGLLLRLAGDPRPLLGVGVDIASRTADQHAACFVSTAAEVLRNAWVGGTIVLEADALVPKPDMLIRVPVADHVGVEARRGRLHARVRRRPRLGQAHRDHQGGRSASARCQPRERQRWCGGGGRVAGCAWGDGLGGNPPSLLRVRPLFPRPSGRALAGTTRRRQAWGPSGSPAARGSCSAHC